MTFETIAQLANIVVPVFICVGLGILWARVGTPFDTRLITSLVYNIGAPCPHNCNLPKSNVIGFCNGRNSAGHNCLLFLFLCYISCFD